MRGTYRLQLIVNDGLADSLPAFVNITVANTLPIANAGLDVYANTGLPTLVDAYASSDVNGDPLTYQWRITAQPNGSFAQLLDPYAVNPRFVPDLAGDYQLELIVHDGVGASLPAWVMVRVVSPQLDGSLQTTANTRLLVWMPKIKHRSYRAHKQPREDTQRFLDDRFTALGWTAEYVEKESDLQTALNQDDFGLYVLLNHGKELDEATQVALHIAVLRGAHLIYADAHEVNGMEALL